ncbi:MAG: acyltransferase [Pseudomonadota bacterium]
MPATPANHTFFPVLHALRGLAALWVMSFHCWFFAGTPEMVGGSFFQLGGYGVHLFYALSAFLLGHQYFSGGLAGGYGGFMRRRFLRIFPAYWVQLILLLALALGWGLYALPDLWALAAHVVMAFHLPPLFVQPINGVWWTLPIEFAFYLVLPALGWLVLRFGVMPFAVLCVAATVAYRAAIFSGMNDRSIAEIANLIGQLPGVLSVFGMGLIAARLVPRRLASRGRALWLFLSLALLVAWNNLLLWRLDSYWQGGWLLYVWESVNAVGLAALIYLAHDDAFELRLSRLWRWLGDVSYGVYLWHLPVILLVLRVLPESWPPSLRFAALAATAPVVFVLAHASFRLIERPAMRLGRQR